MDGTEHQIKEGQILSGRFKLLHKIGQGSFGEVYKTENLETGDILAAKFEFKQKSSISFLVREVKVLTQMRGVPGFPNIIFYAQAQYYNYFLETYLGRNLEDLFVYCNHTFTLPTLKNIATQAIQRIQSLHHKNIIHRDIKPENFVIGRDNNSLIYLIDFGLSKYYKDSNQYHIPQCQNKGLIGTARYASINSLKGNEQSRRDDLESLAYILLYFYLGKLPWMNLQLNKKEVKYQKILEIKKHFIADLAPNLPKVLFCVSIQQFFEEYFDYVSNLQFEEEPDYSYLISLMKCQQEEEEDALDWMSLSTGKKQCNVSIEVFSEVEVPSIREEGNIMQSISKLPHSDWKFLSNQCISNTSLNKHCNAQLKHLTDQASFDSKHNNYQSSKPVSNCLQMFSSSKQFELTTKLDLSIITPLKLSKLCISYECDFEDVDVVQDDEANLVLPASSQQKK